MTRDLGRGVMFEANRETGVVSTYYADGFTATATRPDTPENRQEAAEQGYEGPDAVWYPYGNTSSHTRS